MWLSNISAYPGWEVTLFLSVLRGDLKRRENYLSNTLSIDRFQWRAIKYCYVNIGYQMNSVYTAQGLALVIRVFTKTINQINTTLRPPLIIYIAPHKLTFGQIK